MGKQLTFAKTDVGFILHPMPFLLRPAKLDDLAAINAIYNHYVEHSTCTYQTVLSTAQERRDWFDAHGPEHPVIVAEENEIVIGWGSLSRFHPRQAYWHSVEDSVYIHHEHQGKGLGSLLLGRLVDLAQQIGHHTVLGSIDADEQASIALHAKFGFEKVSHLKEVGHKHGRWLDVIWMQKML
jgi:phosphinothricin acetyltransferase